MPYLDISDTEPVEVFFEDGGDFEADYEADFEDFDDDLIDGSEDLEEGSEEDSEENSRSLKHSKHRNDKALQELI